MAPADDAVILVATLGGPQAGAAGGYVFLVSTGDPSRDAAIASQFIKIAEEVQPT
jgi:hypothetical protein